MYMYVYIYIYIYIYIWGEGGSLVCHLFTPDEFAPLITKQTKNILTVKFQIAIAYFSIKRKAPLFLKIGSFSNYPRVKQLSFTVSESIQPISGSSGNTFSLA